MPSKAPLSAAQQAYLTKVKNLVFRERGTHPTPADGGLSKADYNRRVLAYFQQRLEPREAADQILRRTRAKRKKAAGP